MTTRALVAVIVLAGAPLVPLTATWVRFLRDAGAETPASVARVRLGTILASLSFALLLGSLIWSPLLGPDYSKRRLTMIYANLVLMALVAVAAAFGSKRYKLPLAASGLLIALEWAYLAVISSVV